MTTIDVSQGYKLHVTVSPVPAVGQYHLAIASSWVGAKDPDEQRPLYSATLDKDALLQIANTITQGVSA